MAHQQSHFLAPDSRDNNLQQPKQVLEELLVQFHLLSRCQVRTLPRRHPRLRPRRSLSFPPLALRLLAVDGIADTGCCCKKEGEVYRSRDLRSVRGVEGNEFGERRSNGLLRDDSGEFGLHGHGRLVVSEAKNGLDSRQSRSRGEQVYEEDRQRSIVGRRDGRLARESRQVLVRGKLRHVIWGR